MLKVYDLQGQFKDVVQKFSSRKTEMTKQVNDTVMNMIEDVEKNGDQALMKYCRDLGVCTRSRGVCVALER